MKATMKATAHDQPMLRNSVWPWQFSASGAETLRTLRKLRQLLASCHSARKHAEPALTSFAELPGPTSVAVNPHDKGHATSHRRCTANNVKHPQYSHVSRVDVPSLLISFGWDVQSKISEFILLSYRSAISIAK